MFAHGDASYREAITEAFAQGDHIRHDAPVFHGQPLARSAPARENFICHEENLARIAELTKFREEIIRRHHRATPALNGLENKPSNRPDRGLVQILAVKFDVFIGVDGSVRLGPDMAVKIWPGDHVGTRGTGGTVNMRADLAQRDRPVGFAVVIVKATNRLVLACGRAEYANTCFNCGGAGVVELKAFEVAGQNRSQLLHQLGLNRGGEVVGIHQLRGSFSDAFADLGMTVTEGRHVDAGGEIDVFVAIDIAQHAAGARFKRYGK